MFLSKKFRVIYTYTYINIHEHTNSYACVWILMKKGRRERGDRVGDGGRERKEREKRKDKKKSLLIYL